MGSIHGLHHPRWILICTNFWKNSISLFIFRRTKDWPDLQKVDKIRPRMKNLMYKAHTKDFEPWESFDGSDFVFSYFQPKKHILTSIKGKILHQKLKIFPISSIDEDSPQNFSRWETVPLLLIHIFRKTPVLGWCEKIWHEK